MNYLQMKWSTFIHNYGWSDYVAYLDGWIAKCAMAVPVVGYLILFNDSVSQHLSFNALAQESASLIGLTATSRLKLIYFGLILLGSANIIYRMRRPYIFRVGTNQFDYVERALTHFTLETYIDIHGNIRHEGHRTTYGKYKDSEFDTFLAVATGEADVLSSLNSHVRSEADWNAAKSRFEGLLRAMLIENFFRNNVNHRYALTSCLFLASCGYVLLLVPSLDLFAKVVRVTLRGL
jgi:hypothetical protein